MSNKTSKKGSLLRMRHLAHQRQQIAFSVAEESHPEIVVGHPRNRMRFILKFDSSIFDSPVCFLYVANLKVNDRAGMIEFGFLRFVQHEPDAATIEERQVTSTKEMP